MKDDLFDTKCLTVQKTIRYEKLSTRGDKEDERGTIDRYPKTIFSKN